MEDLQGFLTVATCRVSCRRIGKGHPCPGRLGIQLKVNVQELPAEFCTSSYQEVESCVLEGWKQQSKGDAEDQRSSEGAELRPDFFCFLCPPGCEPVAWPLTARVRLPPGVGPLSQTHPELLNPVCKAFLI